MKKLVISIPDDVLSHVYSHGFMNEEDRDAVSRAILDAIPLDGYKVLKDGAEIVRIAEILETKGIITDGMLNIVKDIVQQAETIAV